MLSEYSNLFFILSSWYYITVFNIIIDHKIELLVQLKFLCFLNLFISLFAFQNQIYTYFILQIFIFLVLYTFLFNFFEALNNNITEINNDYMNENNISKDTVVLINANNSKIINNSEMVIRNEEKQKKAGMSLGMLSVGYLGMAGVMLETGVAATAVGAAYAAIAPFVIAGSVIWGVTYFATGHNMINDLIWWDTEILNNEITNAEAENINTDKKNTFDRLNSLYENKNLDLKTLSDIIFPQFVEINNLNYKFDLINNLMYLYFCEKLEGVEMKTNFENVIFTQNQNTYEFNKNKFLEPFHNSQLPYKIYFYIYAYQFSKGLLKNEVKIAIEDSEFCNQDVLNIINVIENPDSTENNYIPDLKFHIWKKEKIENFDIMNIEFNKCENMPEYIEDILKQNSQIKNIA